MDPKKYIKEKEIAVVICSNDEFSRLQSEFVTCLEDGEKISSLSVNSVDVILLKHSPDACSPEVFKKSFTVLKPGGTFVINKELIKDTSKAELDLKTTGFININVLETALVSSKPKYEVGSSVKLNLAKAPQPVWKLTDDDDDEIIDPDDLLEDGDLKKPDAASLRVCGTTGKRKACKDCSCGLAEELKQEAETGKVIDTTNAPKSSCGSCYLGDAFRCATCPYLGMPAFKPGEKIQLSDDQLKSDL